MLETQQIESVVQQTLLKVQSQESASLFKRPETVRGWVIVIGGLAAFCSFIWTTIVYLHKISEHHKQPTHTGTITLIEELHDKITEHTTDQTAHHREAELKLKILEQTDPIKQRVQTIQADVGTIKTKLDILIDRQERR